MPSLESLFPTGVRWARRLSGRPRRIAAGVCAALAALLILSGMGGSGEEPDESVAVAAREVSAGAVLSADDVVVASWPRSAVPRGSLRSASDAVGRRIGAAMGAGEPITAHRLADGGYGNALRPGAVAMIIAVDAQALLVRAGDRVDIYAANADSASGADIAAGADTASGADIGADPGVAAGAKPGPRLVAANAAVLAALPGPGRGDDGQLVLEVERSGVPAVAAARGLRLTVVLVPP